MADRVTTNPLLALIAHDSATRADLGDDLAVAVHAANRGWTEGHIAAHRLAGAQPDERDMTRTPAPADGDWNVDELLKMVTLLAAPEDRAGIASLAAAIGWAGGIRAGRECAGCWWATTEEEDAARDGQADVTLFGALTGSGHYGRIELPVLYFAHRDDAQVRAVALGSE